METLPLSIAQLFKVTGVEWRLQRDIHNTDSADHPNVVAKTIILVASFCLVKAHDAAAEEGLTIRKNINRIGREDFKNNFAF